MYTPIFKKDDVIYGDDHKVYRLVFDYKSNACLRCAFWKKKSTELGCVGYLKKLFRSEIQKRNPSCSCFCEDVIGVNSDNGAHFIDITSNHILSKWKNISGGK